MENLPINITLEKGIEQNFDKLKLINLATIIYENESIDKNRECDLIICSEKTIKSLNAEYRNKNYITDVLSYPFNDDDYLGEIYICKQRAIEQSIEYKLSFQDELSRLLVHGIFHLLGFDHLTEDERDEMESLEKKYFDPENL